MRIFVRVGRGAAAEEPEGGGRGDLVAGTRGDEDGVTRGDLAPGAVNFHGSRTLEDEVKLLAGKVAVAQGRGAGRDRGFGEALVLNRGARAVEEAPDPGPIGSCKWFLAG